MEAANPWILRVVKNPQTLTEEHQPHLWQDEDGYVWYWDTRENHWTYLFPSQGGWRKVNGEAPAWELKECAPYKRIDKGRR